MILEPLAFLDGHAVAYYLPYCNVIIKYTRQFNSFANLKQERWLVVQEFFEVRKKC